LTRPAFGNPVAFVRVPLDGVPSAPLSVTNAPALPTFTASAVATPVPSPDTPVEIGSPIKFVAVPADGVPIFGVISTGEVASTALPVPVTVQLATVGGLLEPVLLHRTPLVAIAAKPTVPIVVIGLGLVASPLLPVTLVTDPVPAVERLVQVLAEVQPYQFCPAVALVRKKV